MDPALIFAQPARPVLAGLRAAVIGGGVSGLGIAWMAARAGADVTLFERDALGRGASWAAAGMLPAGLEAEPGEQALYALARLSMAQWPAFAGALGGEAALGYRREGTIALALTRDDLDRLRFRCDYQTGLGARLEPLTAAEARRREPHLRAGLAGAVYSPDDHQVDNRKLVLALITAAQAAGVKLRDHCPVTAIRVGDAGVTGVQADGAELMLDRVVLAAGAWSAGIAGLPADARPPVRPVKGQMLAAQMDPANPLLRHVLWTPNVYLVPRLDGRLLVGATVEEQGFDANQTVGGMLALCEGAWRALPGIEELPVVETWVGFRPTSRDDAPILGEALPGLIIATGHHRNGILLAPVTAWAITELLRSGAVPDAVAGFTPARFQRAVAA